MNILGRYVLKEHVGPFIFASTALTSIMLLQYIAKKFGELVGKGLPASVIAEFMGLSVPFTVAMTLPMAVLVAVLYAFSRLAAENEITAMKASGIGMRRVLLPVLAGGFVLSIVMLAFNDQVLPRANHRLAVLQMNIFRTKPTFALREQVINEIKSGQIYLRAGNVDEASKLTDVVIYDLSNPMRRRTIHADSGELFLANGRDLDLTLYHGVMEEIPNDKPHELTRLFYEITRKRVKGVFSSYQESSGSVSKGDREMSVCEMQLQMSRAEYERRKADYEIALIRRERAGGGDPRPEAPRSGETRAIGLGGAYCALLGLFSPLPGEAHAQQAQTSRPAVPRPATSAPARPRRLLEQPVSKPPVSKLPDSVIRNRQDHEFVSRIQEHELRRVEALRERNRYDVEIQKKFSLAASCLIFVLVGAPIALRFPRGGVGLVIGVSFAIFGLYYVGLIGGETLADKALLPPWVAMWGANLILFITGLVLASRMGRESSTTRGGDFSELLAATRAKLFGWLRNVGVPVERRRA